MKRAANWKGNLSGLLERHQYQPALTSYLDQLGSRPFAQNLINEIVLWKVNRYAKLSPSALKALNRVADIRRKSHRTAEATVATLLCEPGVDIAMASTFLRFRNKKTFQIIDRHAYRALYGKKYPLHPKSSDNEKIDLYFRYLDDLWAFADSKKLSFTTVDRVLYVFDRQFNGKL